MKRVKISLKQQEAPTTGILPPQPVFTIEIDGKPVDMGLVQSVSVSIDAESMMARVTLCFLASDVDVDVPAEVREATGLFRRR